MGQQAAVDKPDLLDLSGVVGGHWNPPAATKPSPRRHRAAVDLVGMRPANTSPPTQVVAGAAQVACASHGFDHPAT